MRIKWRQCLQNNSHTFLRHLHQEIHSFRIDQIFIKIKNILIPRLGQKVFKKIIIVISSFNFKEPKLLINKRNKALQVFNRQLKFEF